MVICTLCDAPSKFAQKVHPVFADGPPMVTAAIGTNKYDWLSEEYLFLFLSAAASAAAPGVWDVS